MKHAYIIAVLALVSGCAPTMWKPPSGGSYNQGMSDIAFCNAQATATQGNTQGFFGVAIFDQNRDMCMQGKGYTKKD